MSAASILGRSAGPPPSPGSRLASGVSRVAYYLPALLVAVGTLVLWEVVVGALAIKAFIFPQPSAIYAALIGNWASPQYPLFASAQSTLYEAAGGLVIGTTAGVVVAFATSRWATTRGVLLPIAIAANAVVVVGMAQNPMPKRARKALDAAGIAHHYLEYGSYFNNWRRRNALKMWSGWPTFPMVFVSGVLIGGADDLDRLIASGEIKRML